MVQLDIGTPGTSREIYSENADDELRVRVPSSAGIFLVGKKTVEEILNVSSCFVNSRTKNVKARWGQLCLEYHNSKNPV